MLSKSHVLMLVLAAVVRVVVARASDVSGVADTPYADMPGIAPIGVRIGHYLPVPQEAKGPAVDAAKGYRIEELGKGLYMITDNVYQSMFMVYETGVVVVDAPPSYATHIVEGVRQVTDKPITHLIYSHSHTDHIGGTNALGKVPTIIAQEETKRLLARANDTNRPLPTTTFRDRYSLKAGSQVLELSYHGDAHEPGNIFIYAPAQQTLMVVDGVSGLDAVATLRRGARRPRLLRADRRDPQSTLQDARGRSRRAHGTHADVDRQIAFLQDLKGATATALRATKPGEGLDQNVASENPWAVFDDYIDRVVIQCVNTLTPTWSNRLAAYDLYIWDQCYSMEQSLRID